MTKTHEKPKPCWSCRQVPIVFQDEGGFNVAHICGGRGLSLVANHDTKEDAVSEWNKMQAKFE